MLNYSNQQAWTNGWGKQQSPLALNTTNAVAVSKPLAFQADANYQLKTEIDDETTIRVAGTGEATIFNRPFSFVQVHFHAPAEHVVDGTTSPFEIHLVHQNAIGQLVVVALLVSIGNADPTLQAIFDRYRQKQTTSVEIPLPVSEWLTQAPTGFHYLGSITTPPLTEGVEWLVITNPIVIISADQLAWFTHHFKANNRDVQPPLNRPIGYYHQ